MKKTLLMLSAAAISAGAANAAGAGFGTGRPLTSFRVPQNLTQSINPLKAAAQDETVLFYEGFEGNPDTGNISWLPDGWERTSKGDPTLTDIEKWYNGTTTSTVDNMPSGAEGSRFELIVASNDKQQDEWLMTPTMTIRDNDRLSFKVYFLPFYFFYTDSKHYDWQNGQWINQEICQDFKLYVRIDGEENFTLLHSFAEDYMGVSYNDLMKDDLGGKMKDFTQDLTAYVGKKVRFAFQYIGMDGNAVMIDAVRVGFPETTPAYSAPYSTLYYGTMLNGNYSLAPETVAVFPAASPIVFTNDSPYIEGQTFSWSAKSADGEEITSDSEDDFTVSFNPVYAGTSTEFVAADNWHPLPTLTMSAPDHSPASYTWDIRAMQTGGNAAYNIAGQTETSRFGLLQSNPSLDFDFLTEDIDFGVQSVPVFGHNAGSTEWWTDHFFNGEPQEGESVSVRAILNYIYPASSPLVINGVTFMGYGLINENSRMKVEFIRLNEDFEPEETAFASAEISGKDVIGRDPEMNSILAFPFTLDAPVVIDANDAPAYIVKLSGFNSDEVPYFAPLQSWKPADICLGFAEVAITSNGVTRPSYIPSANFSNEYGEMMSGFCFNFDAYFPWLIASEETINLSSGVKAEVALDSYLDGTAYKVEAPEWLTATVTGRYKNARLELVADKAQEARKGTVTISATGVSKTFTVEQAMTGIDNIAADGRTVKEIYTISGQRVDADNLFPGVYVVKYTDGTVAKTIVR